MHKIGVFIRFCSKFLPTLNTKQRVRFHLLELPLTDAVSVDDDTRGLEQSGLVEGDEQLPHHGAELLDHLLTVLLDPHGCRVTTGVGVHAPHHLKSTELVHSQTEGLGLLHGIPRYRHRGYFCHMLFLVLTPSNYFTLSKFRSK